MLDHVGFPVSDFTRAKSFYAAALAPLGYVLMMEITNEQTGGHGDHAGFGDGRPDFWIGTGKTAASSTHVAFHAKDRATVDAFYQAAIAAGGRDNGAPGLRPHYHAHYYGAFVLDADGNNVEAVCHTPE
ncbi:VOC family protein [Bradyrhizobium ontarionense]|uniref:VOC family protein n=1 Tax=Bradyrhizobium ontarionense TaxID=2898149 RepID=A0ABY3RI21_9BRAD|nr:VOC family protein [Bradyrhizobium sp. A19]UFZ07055.1 VOC family protein [Bradyrhizobium sp. A19]